MKKIFSLFALMLVFATSISAQNWYVKSGFGWDFALDAQDEWYHGNKTFNFQVGYFYNSQSAVELDYSHGFQKNFVSYNRVGLNYLYETTIVNTSFIPYVRGGFGYRLYHFDDDLSDYFGNNMFFGDVKLGFGFHYYLDEDVSLNFGLDASYMFNDDVYEFKETFNFQPHIGIAFNF